MEEAKKENKEKTGQKKAIKGKYGQKAVGKYGQKLQLAGKCVQMGRHAQR